MSALPGEERLHGAEVECGELPRRQLRLQGGVRDLDADRCRGWDGVKQLRERELPGPPTT
jgi:hypothetical protein